MVPQVQWSMENGALGALYVNTDYPPDAGGPYRWGLEGARQAVRDARALGLSAPLWWLEVETANRWSPDTAANTLVSEG